jgi:cobalt/nickel transport protein
MDMGKPEKFFVVRKEKQTDLLTTLKPISWVSLTNSGAAYEASYKLRGMGDNVFCLVPAPYLEKNEDCYIQQITKMIVNTGGFPTDWDAEIGLPAEIVPLDKPYALWTGNVFRGIVKGGGKPVPFAEIEVEYLNHLPVMDKNAFSQKAEVKAPQDAFVVQTIKANADGEFSFGIPKAGWWGFCALGAGPNKEYKGKELSQDAVIWVKAVDMK